MTAFQQEALNNDRPMVASLRAARSKPARTAVKAKVIEVKSPREKGAPTEAQQEALIIKYRTKARKLGRSILRRWHARLDIEEVDSLVDLSLCEAVRRFNPRKGASFMTFLYYHLKGNLVRAVATAANSHSVPVYNLAEGETSKDGSEYQFRPLSANEVAEALTNNESISPDEALWKKELQSKSVKACEKLDALERDIIERIYTNEEQIMDIASELGYSRCHISRVKKRALETLHGELAGLLGADAVPGKPVFEDEGVSPVERQIPDRRMIHRRRPRSKRIMDLRPQRFIAAA
jgi:RNA polymerase sigma factor for flagellar operon FliA